MKTFALDGIITDYPDRAVKVFKKKFSPPTIRIGPETIPRKLQALFAFHAPDNPGISGKI